MLTSHWKLRIRSVWFLHLVQFPVHSVDFRQVISTLFLIFSICKIGNTLTFICSSGLTEGSLTNPQHADVCVKHSCWITMISIGMDLEKLEVSWPLTTFLSTVSVHSDTILLQGVWGARCCSWWAMWPPRWSAGLLSSRPPEGRLRAAAICFHPVSPPAFCCPTTVRLGEECTPKVQTEGWVSLSLT